MFLGGPGWNRTRAEDALIYELSYPLVGSALDHIEQVMPLPLE